MTTRSSSTYFVNDIPRGVLKDGLISFLASLANGSSIADFDVSHYTGSNPKCLSLGDSSDFQGRIEKVVVTDSQLDDELSVAIVTFKDTPKWFKSRDNDPYGFPKKTRLGTIWKGVDMMAMDDDGRTAFLRAVIDGNLKLAETLAEYKETNINAQDNQGMTALHWACKNGLAELTAFCLSLPGLDVSVKSKDGKTGFDVAYREALWDDNDAIPTLFYKNMFEMDEYDPDNALLRLLTLTTDPRGKTLFPQEALFSPSRNGNLALVQALLPNITFTGPVVTNKYGETALHMAAGGGHTEIVTLLVRCGYFDINAVTTEGCTALDYAARGGYSESVKELVHPGINSDTKNINGHTAAELAMQNAHQSTAQTLTGIGANVKVKTPKNEVEHVSGEEESTGFGDRGITTGATIDTILGGTGERERDRSSSLGEMIETEIVTGIERRGGLGISGESPAWPGSPKSTSNGGHQIGFSTTPTISTTFMGKLATSRSTTCSLDYQKGGQNDLEVKARMDRLLHKCDGDVNGRDEHGLAPLHEAILSGDANVTIMLLDAGADIEGRLTTWVTPVEIAELKGDKTVASLLRERGAKTAADNWRERELELAPSVEYTNSHTIGQQITPLLLPIEKSDESEDVTEMELPLDQEPDAGTPSRSETPDNDSYQETMSPDPRNEGESDAHPPSPTQPSYSPPLENHVHLPAFTGSSYNMPLGVLMPLGQKEEGLEHHQEVSYEDDAAQEYGYSSPARSASPQPADDEYSEGYGNGYGDYSDDYPVYNGYAYGQEYNDAIDNY